MAPPPRFAGNALRTAAFLAVTIISSLAAATIRQQISPGEVVIGDQAIITITVQNGSVDDVNLPPVDGLQIVGTRTASSYTLSNGSLSRSMSFIFAIEASHSGNFTIPAFDVRSGESELLHVKSIKLHVLDSGLTASPSITAPAIPVPAPASAAPFNPNGPVILPSTNAATAPASPNNGNAVNSTVPEIDAPRDPDSGPAKVFIIITPQTTDAYLGQSIPMQIDFYIRGNVNSDQNSLPTIKGSDFLMNNFTTRGRVGLGVIENIQYLRETWITAISAPKSGDFPLSMERNTYWVKSITNVSQNTLFGSFFGPHRNVAHEFITSNLLTMHIHALPPEGRPDHFTGVIGQLKVTGVAAPPSVNVGEPVNLRFTVSGEGNFDYVRCPALNDDPAWKAYVPSSKTSYLNESRTQALKTFEQSIIPQKNGNVPLPSASFSYFDPATKQYVIVPIPLPIITVTGSPTPVAAVSSDVGNDSTTASVTPKTADYLPNRLDIGSTRTSLTPVYRQPWFWAAQTGLIALPLVGALLLFFRSRFTPDDARAERALRRRSQQQEEDAMAEAVRRGDAVAFFLAARHAIQLQLGAQWNLKPEAITLGEIRSRDPHLAETLEPLFAQADEVIYSGKASPPLDLAQWEQRVRTELLQPQPA
jgi:hypothetical protein